MKLAIIGDDVNFLFALFDFHQTFQRRNEIPVLYYNVFGWMLLNLAF